MLTVFFNLKEFATMDLLPQNTSFTTGYLATNVILPLAIRHAQQLRDIGRRKLYLHFDNSRCHTAQHVQEQTVNQRCVRVPPYSSDLAIAEFNLFVRLKQ
jgi:hypothetical protein